LLGWGGGFCGDAAAPVLDHFFPVALKPGTTNTVVAVGKFEPWPPKIWSESPAIRFEATTNSGTFTVVTATNAPVGAHFVRAFNEEGASSPRFLLVTRQPQLAEVEPNDDFTAPMAVDLLPVTLNGRLEKPGDVDSFGVTLVAGQTLVASVDAYTLMSPLDTVLRVVDSRGVVLALNHDDGRTLDSRVTWTAKTAGRHIVQLFGFAYPAGSEIRFTGNGRCVYRLHLTTGPVIRYTLPLGVRRGGNTALELFGWNLGAPGGRPFDFDGSGLGADVALVPFQPPEFALPIELPVGEGPEIREHEPNQTLAEANPVSVPGAVTGCLAVAGDEDRYAFEAKKGQLLQWEVQSAVLGFPLDAWLRVDDATGKELARNDDGLGPDPRLEWTAPEDGTYYAVVGSLLHRGAAEYLYRLAVTRPVPSLKATVVESAFALEFGKTNEIKVTYTRRFGLATQLTITANGLPEGVLGVPVEVPEKSGEVVVKLVANADAKPFSGPIQLLVQASAAELQQNVVMELISAGENNGVPQGYKKLVREAIAQLWLTVMPPPPAKKPEEKK